MRALGLVALVLVTACGSVSDPLVVLDPGECFYCGPPGCGLGAWHPCELREALASACSGHAACDEPPGKVGIFDGGKDGAR